MVLRDSLAQDDRYRVELLVLTHLNQPAAPHGSAWLKDYSSALDFLSATEPEEELIDPCAEGNLPADSLETAQESATASALGAGQQGNPALPGASVEPGLTEADVPGEEEEPDPTAVFPVTEMSDTMQEAWRRLRLSAPFRPQQYLSWEQGSNEPFPRLRLHDEEVVDSDDPYARERFERELLAAQAELEAEAGGQVEQQPDCSPATLPNEPPAEPELPEPNLFYRLDGSVTLRRGRFLHLDIDLQLREAVFEETEVILTSDGPPAIAPQSNQPGTDAWSPPDENEKPVFVAARRPSAFLVHGLEQSRQVRSGRLEYFDGPVLGLLALITRIEASEPEDPQP